jgi:rhodanese-related sulfurtransferase
MKVLLSLFLLIGCLSCTQAQTQAGIITQDVAAFKKTIASKKVQLLDVRTPVEFSDGNITGSTNMDVKSNQFKDMAGKLDKKKPVAVYCRSGMRSATAANILKEMGFKKIYNLDGGYLAWTK